MIQSLRSAMIGSAGAGASAATLPMAAGCRAGPGTAWVGGGKLAPSGADGASVMGAGALATARSVRRLAGACAADRGAGVSATAVRRDGVAVAGAGAGAGGSAGRVVVPGKLKFWSSRGPIALVAGVLVVAGGVVSWASAEAGASIAPAASNIVLKRKPALIVSRSGFNSPPFVPRRVPPMPAPSRLFKHRFDEPHRTQVRPAKW